jgi:hypothetical protein
MKIRRALLVIPALSLLAIGTTASAQTDLTCADISFTYEVTSKYPSVADGCRDVVEVDGERYAKMRVEIMTARGNVGTFRFMNKDGSYGPLESVTVDDDWRAELGGRSYRMRQLSPGQEMNIYIPGDKWEAHVAKDMSGTITVYYAIAFTGASDSGSALPTTASPLPLIGMLGVGSMFTAFLMRVRRRRQS